MAEFSYLDESLDINQTPLYHLSIQTNLNGLSFCILNTVNDKYIALKHYPLPAEDKNVPLAERFLAIIKKDEFLQRKYKSLALMTVTFKSTLIPAPLFVEKDKERFFRFNYTLEEGEVVLQNRMKGLDAYCLFTIHTGLYDMIQQHFPDVRIFHQTTPFLDDIIRNQKVKGKTPVIFLNIHDDFFDIAIFKEQNPELVNSFYYKQVNDLIYFVLYAIKMLKIDPATVPLTLSGNVTPRSSLSEALRRYIRHISFATRNSSFTYSYTFGAMPEHIFSNLFNLYRCV